MADAAWLLALASAGFFGLALVLTQFGLRHLPPLTGAVASIPTSALLFWAAAPLLLDAGGWRIDAAAIFAAVGLLFPAAVTLLTFEANRRMGPNVAGALGNLAPLFAVLFAVIALGERPASVQLIGIAAIVLGVTALSADRTWLATRWPLWAIALPLVAAGIRGAIQPTVKLGLALWPSAFAATLIGYTVSATVIAGAVTLRANGQAQQLNQIGAAWFAAVGLSNGLAVLTMYAALSQGPVTLVSPLVATYPLVTLALSALLLHAARLTVQLCFGVAVTVAGVALLLTNWQTVG